MKTLTFNFLFIFSILVYSQNISGVIKYRLSITSGLTDRDLTSYLYFNDKKSLYAYDRLAYMTKEDSAEKAVVIAGQGKSKRKRDKYGQMYLIDKTTGKLSFREFIFSGIYISQEDIPAIPWQLENETKVILGKVCKKATTEFRRRKYTVWYTSSIPVSVGPWKLQGLPGAILEARSADNEVAFIAEEIEIPAHEKAEKELNFNELPDGKIVTYQEFLEAMPKEKSAWLNKTQTTISALFEKAKQDGIASQDLPTPKFDKVSTFSLEKYPALE